MLGRRNPRRPLPRRGTSSAARRHALSRMPLARSKRSLSLNPRHRPLHRPLSRPPYRGLRRNAEQTFSEVQSSAKQVGIGALLAGAGYMTSLGIGTQADRLIRGPNPLTPMGYAPIIGNLIAIIGFEVAQRKIPFVRENDRNHLLSVGAGLALLYNLVTKFAGQNSFLTPYAGYLPGAVAPLPVPAIDVTMPADAAAAAPLQAFVEQAGLYGMGASPIEAEIQHKLNMFESGMQGGIFDSKTTLGALDEYDVLTSAPAGTRIQSALAEYIPTPGMGANVRVATAGMGANVQEAFAGMGSGLREYITVPLADYVGTGGGVQSSMPNSTLQAVTRAAQAITQRRLRQGQPVDARYAQDLQRAALAVVAGNGSGVQTVEPPAPLTNTAPFPGMSVQQQNFVGGIPEPLSAQDDEGNEGIFG